MADQSTSSDIRVQQALADYLERIDRGDQVDVEVFLKDRPTIAPELRSLLAASEMLAGMAGTPAGDTAAKNNSPTIAPKSVPASALTGPTGAIVFPAMMGRYRLERELGRGAMGNVYLAHDTDLDRPVALKIPKFTAADNQELIARFLREARAAAVLAHPNICRVYDVNEHQGVRYIAMEFIEGKPLSAFIAGGNVQAKQAASVIRKLALGLAEAHQRNILHRDLKPDNILVNKQGEPVLTDFGLARETTAGKASATQDGVILGSPAYMPPEQAAGNLSEMGPTSDIYSLGVVLYEMLTGEVPFRGSVVEVLASVLMKTPKTVREQKPDIDPGIAAICDKMMAKKAGDRYPTMMAVAQALGDWLRTGGQQQAATSSKLPEPLSNSGEFKIADPKSKLAAGPHIVEPKKIPGVNDKPKQTIAPGTAKQTISPTATKTPERTEKQINELAELGDQLLARNDYLEAIRLAEEIPDYQRTPALRRMLGESYELKGKVEKLERNLEKYLNTLDLPELKKTVTALLKIHPGHPRGKEIKKALNTGGKKAVVQILKDEGNYDAVGNVWEPKVLAGGIAGILALAVIAYFAVTIYIKGTMQEVAITIDDPTATVKIDGKDVLIEGQQTGSVKLTIGSHEYTVTQGGTTVRNAHNFTVNKDGQNKLVITLKEPEKKPEPPIGNNKPSPTKVADSAPGVFDGHTAGVLSVEVSPDGRFAYSGSDDQTVRGWEIASGKELWRYETGGQTYGLAVSADGKQLAIGSHGGTWVVNAATGEKIQQFAGPAAQTQGVKFTNDGSQIVTSGVDGNIRRWNIADGKETLLYDRTGNTHTAIVIAPDQSEVFAASGGGTIEAWDFATGKPRDSFQDAAVYGLAFSPDGTLLAGARDDKSAGVWDWKTRKLMHRFDDHTDRVMDVAFLPDGQYLVSGGLDKKMILWNLDTKQKVKEWPAHEAGDSLGVRSVAVTPNGQFIVSGGYDAKVRVWKSPVAVASTPAGAAPPLAVAPFDSTQAKAHQEAWAKYLGVPVEYTNSIGMKFRLIPPGEYLMGGTPAEIQEFMATLAPDDTTWQTYARSWGPQHQVRLTKPFYLGMHEVTQQQYETVMGYNPAAFHPESRNPRTNSEVKGMDTSNFPVDSLTWTLCQEFCSKLGQMTSETGGSYRLPTEAEWEYACRAGTSTLGWPGDKAEQVADAENFQLQRTRDVMEGKPNPFGLNDTLGNLREWVEDRWAADYYQQAKDGVAIDPKGPESGDRRIVRSGSWGTSAIEARSALRIPAAPEGFGSGFRVALSIEAVKQPAPKPAPSGRQRLRLAGLVDGAEEIHIYPDRIEWKHLSASMPREIRVNSRDWTDLTKPFPNAGGDKYFADAKLPAQPEFAKLAGRGKVTFQDKGDHWYLDINDADNGEGQYAIEISWLGAVAAAPPAAVAPFDATQAKAHQEAWAKHLGVPVEYTNNIGMKFRLIPPGEYQMGGSPDDGGTRPDESQHKVTVTKPFYLGVTEVTLKQWTDVMRSEPWKEQQFPPPGPTGAANYVNWNDATAFCEKLKTLDKTGGNYRLPTEAEWEMACRAGAETHWYFGNDEVGIEQHGWYRGNAELSGEMYPHPVAQKLPNSYGLYDVSGNLWEWCSDFYDEEFYKVSPSTDPTGPAQGKTRVNRGGSWISSGQVCRIARRSNDDPVNPVGFHITGLRVAISIDAVKQAIGTNNPGAAPPLAVAHSTLRRR